MICKMTTLVGALLLLLAWMPAGRAQSPPYFQVGPDTIEDRLRRYEGEDAERSLALERLFEEVGCRRGERLEEQTVPDADAPNMVCTLPGSTDDVIVVGAHFDRVDEGNGVADNWSGASLLPSLYQSLSSKMRRHTFVFIGFSDEEEGYIGSGHYVDQLTGKQLTSIKAMINLDTLGLDTTKVWDSNSDPGLVGLLKQVAESNQLPVGVMNVDDYGDSDGSSFKKRNVPIITLHSVTLQTIGILHTEKDVFSAIKLDDYYDTYVLIARFLSALDQK